MSTTARHKQDVTIDFDHHRSIAEFDPEQAYAELRETCPVAWSERYDGYWVVSSYPEVDRVVKDYRAFSSTDGMAIPPHPFGAIPPVELDPPEHTAYRRALNPLLTKEAVSALLPRLEWWTAFYIDQVIESGTCDLIYDLGVPVPAAVTLEWVGWDEPGEWMRIAEAWHDVISRPVGSPEWERARHDLAWFEKRIIELLEDRRREPRDDVISYIARLELDGKPISHEDQVGLVRIVIAGGVDTTTSVIGSALVHLDEHPEHRERLRSEPDLWETATEEFLRRYPPTRMTARTATTAVEVGGCLMEPGDRILAAIGSACHDESAFPRAQEVVLDRSPNNHLAFGSGVHRCIGMHLARQEFRIVVGQVLERMPDYRLVREHLQPYVRQSEMSGWISARATFTPGPRLLPRDAGPNG